MAADSIRFGECTLESDSHVVLKEKQGEQTALTIVELANGNQVVRRPIQAEAAVMSPNGKVIALRAQSTIQMFNIVEKKKVKSYKLEEDPSGLYWRWIGPEMLAIVTATSVYHWSTSGTSDPEKIFDRHANLASSQIISYRTSADGKWCCLVGIAQGAQPGTIDGAIQLYSIEKRVSQPLTGHAACFATIQSEGYERQVFCFVERKPGMGPKLFCMEVGKDKDAPGGVFKVAPQDIPFPPEAAADFPVSLLPSKKHDLLYCLTKLGYLYVLDIFTAETVYRNRVSQETVFVTCSTDSDSAMLGITARTGKILKIGMNDPQLVPYLLSIGKSSTAMRLATKLGLPGAVNLYQVEFDRMYNAGDVAGAARVAAESPRGMLRTAETIQKFQRLPAVPGQPAPLLQYFQTLLARGKLNAIESIELSRPVIASGRLQMMEQWLKEDKLECSEQLGDMLVQADPKMALSVYMRGNAPDKVIQAFLHMGDFASVVQFAKQSNHHPDYVILLQNLVRQDPKKAEAFAKMLVADNPPMVNVSTVVDIFMQLGRIQETTAFLFEALKGDKPEDGALQTRLLEINLLGGAPQVADAIFASEMFTRYDRTKIGKLCEKAGLYQRALEHYSDPADIKRVIVYTQALNPEFLLNYFGKLPAEECLQCLHLLLQHNLKANLATVVQVASKYYEQVGTQPLIDLFSAYRSYEGLYYFTGAILSFTQDPQVHFKNLEASAKMGQIEQVIKVCRESTAIDPLAAKEFLITEKFPDPRALIFICDRFGYVDELTTYLFNNKLHKHILVYVEKMSPQNAPQVVGRLLDLDADEQFITQLLDAVRRECPVEKLVEEVEKRNRLRLLRPWLEQRVAEGNSEPATHNALAKIRIQTGDDPETFLVNNSFYDAKVVGAFARKLDPHLSFVAYRRAWGKCDEELLELTNENELFKDQARYLVERRDPDLWARVLNSDNKHRSRLVDETVQTALPECRDPEGVSATVRAFMAANLPNELIQVLDRLVLQGTPGDGFSENPNLQDLLMWTAIQTEPHKVMDLVHRLDHFNAAEMAQRACSDQYKLYEEAFEMLKKARLSVEALEVLLVHIDNMDRAVEFATRTDDSKVWSRLGRAQLDANFIKEAIDSFIKADDAEPYPAVIEAANREEKYDDLVRYLRMARKKVKESSIDSELLFALAKTNKISDLEEVVSSPNVANVQEVGDRCFNQGMYEAAAVLFQAISNNAQLARAYVKLGKFKEAVECARKANAIKSWKEVNAACVEAGEWRLAEVSGTHILKSHDHVDDLVAFYEAGGHYEKLIALFEKGLSLEGANKSVFTGLAVLYAKHNPAKLMDHIKAYPSKLIMPKVLHACEEQRLWKECAAAYEEAGEFDNAVRIMMDHFEAAWDNSKFLEDIVQVRNPELLYKSITFYLQHAPELLGTLLAALQSKLDHARAVAVLKKGGLLHLAVPYLQAVQTNNLAAVNEALNDVFIEEENFEALQNSINDHNNFDHVALAQKLEKHELQQFRRVAASLYAKQKKFGDAIKLLKADKLYKDAMETVALSKDSNLVMDLIKFFVEHHEKECFTAALYTCYDLVSPDVVLELAWRHGLHDVAMPYLIQWTRDTHNKLKELDERTKPKSEQSQEATSFIQPPGGNMYMLANTAYNPEPQGYGMPTQPGYGMPPQQQYMQGGGYGGYNGM